jgi:hypothetical protein
VKARALVTPPPPPPEAAISYTGTSASNGNGEPRWDVDIGLGLTNCQISQVQEGGQTCYMSQIETIYVTYP